MKTTRTRYPVSLGLLASGMTLLVAVQYCLQGFSESLSCNLSKGEVVKIDFDDQTALPTAFDYHLDQWGQSCHIGSIATSLDDQWLRQGPNETRILFAIVPDELKGKPKLPPSISDLLGSVAIKHYPGLIQWTFEERSQGLTRFNCKNGGALPKEIILNRGSAKCWKR